jgi:hypothetical protein
MNTKGLSLNTIPPISIPLRFFLSAPLFGLLAALLILYYGPQIWDSRWDSSSLALTHLLTIGFMLMLMFGALYQFIPVMIGQLVPGSKKLAPIIHFFLIIGTLSLSSAFLLSINYLYWLSFISLGLAVLLFALSLFKLLLLVLEHRLIVFLLRILFLVLLITISLGLYLLFAYANPEYGIIFKHYTNIHALWGLIGWVVLIILAVSSQVIPMFYVTPAFSVQYLKLLSFFIFVTLLLISLVTVSFKANNLLNFFLSMALSFELIFFASYTFRLINQRKRKLPDATIKFFYLSLISLLLALLFWWCFFIFKRVYPLQALQYHIQFEFALAIVLIYGLALSTMIGLLQKIFPFLVYLHLQKHSFKHPGSMSHVPNMKKVISTRSSKIQFYLHLSSFSLLFISLFFLQLTWLAGFVMLFNFIFLSYSLFKGYYLYKNNLIKILAYPEFNL